MSGHSFAVDYATLDDNALAHRVQDGDREAFRHIIRRCNQRLFRVARGVVHSDQEAEDVVQEAYVDAFENIAGFRGEASLRTWLTRIVLNEAYGRLRQRHPLRRTSQGHARRRSTRATPSSTSVRISPAGT